MKRFDRNDGPIKSNELETYLERGYSKATLRWLTSVWESEDNPKALMSVVETTDVLKPRFQEVSDDAKAAFTSIQRHGGRVRGENLRRESLLVGGADLTVPLQELVQQGLLVVVPNPGDVELDVEPLIANGQFVYHELAVPEALFESNASFDESVASHQGKEDVGEVEPGSTDLLELNLLTLAVELQRVELRLNKNGSPNRRSLARVATGIVMPGQKHELGEDFDPNDVDQIDYTLFVLAIAEELQMLVRDEDKIVGAPVPTKAFFDSTQESRDRQLMQAFRVMKNWHEVPPGEEEGLDEIGALDAGRDAIALRGYVVSVLKRANFSQWTAANSVVDLCRLLDEGFFTDAVGKIGVKSGRAYVRALVLRALHWLGLVDVGDDNWIRFTERGQMMLGQTMEVEPAKEQPCMVVQPNMEIMVFLDAATTTALHEVYVLSERTNVADRVINFSLSPQNVQRAFAQGRTADSVAKTLSKFSSVPVPDSIKVQLEDWERLHQRVEIRTDGFLLRHRDPEHLDMLVDEMMVDRNSPPTAVRLGPTAVFMTNVSEEALRKFLDRHGATHINYDGVIPPCLEFVDPLKVAFKPIQADIVTWHELPQIADEVDGEVGYRTFEINASKVRKRYPDNPIHAVCEFLSEHTDGGLPPAQRIALMSALGESPQVDFRNNATLLVVDSDEIGEIFAEMEESNSLIHERLGPRAFQLIEGTLERAQELLRALGVDA